MTGDKPQFFFLERYMQSFIEEMRQFVRAVAENSEVPVGIKNVGENTITDKKASVYYSLNGMRLPDESSARGIVITDGKKVLVK